MPVRVLVVDDSLFMRTLVSHMLNSAPEIQVVDTAKNGTEAMKKIPKTRPDCITLDLAMPAGGGLSTLKHIMSQYPTPVVVLSAHSKENADITIQCLNAGAVSFVLKPSGEISLDIDKIKDQLIKEIKAAAKAKVRRIRPRVTRKPKRLKPTIIGRNHIVIMGASTGGPQALEAILPSLPFDFPVPILVAQHMPNVAFTESLANHLNDASQLTVKVAEHNEVIQAGTAYLGPGGFNMTLEAGRAADVRICLSKAEPDRLTPSIDIAMKSAARIYNENTVGIILSGIGNDGVDGTRAIKESGGKAMAQDESSLIFGMPKAVIDAGFADEAVSMADMADAMVELMAQSA